MRRACNGRHEPAATKIRTEPTPLEQAMGRLFDPLPRVVPDYDGWYVETTCEWGNCVELRCPVCGRMRMGWGPMDCPCDDWRVCPGMRRRRPVAVKPSDHRRPSKRMAGRRKRR